MASQPFEEIWRLLHNVQKSYFKWFLLGLHVSAHTRRRRLTLVAFLAPAFEARRMHRWVGATLPQHTLPYLVAAPPPLDDWRPTSDIIDWQIVREESIELDWSLHRSYQLTDPQAQKRLAIERLTFTRTVICHNYPLIVFCLIVCLFSTPSHLGRTAPRQKLIGKIEINW